MKFAAVIALICIFALEVLANNNTELECHSYKKGALKLYETRSEGPEFYVKEVGGVIANNTAMLLRNNHSLLSKGDKPLHAELFKCKGAPTDVYVHKPMYQLRAHGKCATLAMAGGGIQYGLQLEDCGEKLAEKREQWFMSGSQKTENATGLYSLKPNFVFDEFRALEGVGVVSSFSDALSFSYTPGGNVSLAVMLELCE